jgi:hypothetical protein
VDVLPEDRVRINPDLWGRMAGFIEKRERICARYQTFDGRESEYRLHPYHLLAYHGNWYLLAHNEEKGRMATFALSRFRDITGTGQVFRRPPDYYAHDWADRISTASMPGAVSLTMGISKTNFPFTLLGVMGWVASMELFSPKFLNLWRRTLRWLLGQCCL